MNPETKICQNCKGEFVIEPEDFNFYEKIKVPPPTWCPECRMIRRLQWRNEHSLFRRLNAEEGKNDLIKNYIQTRLVQEMEQRIKIVQQAKQSMNKGFRLML